MENLPIDQTTDPVGVLVEDPDNGGIGLSVEDAWAAEGHVDAGQPTVDTNHDGMDEPISHSPPLTPASVQDPDVRVEAPETQFRVGIVGTDISAEVYVCLFVSLRACVLMMV